MQIWYPGWTVRDDGDYGVTFNSGNENPFAIIRLSEDGNTALIVQSPEEADRLIKAAVKAKQLLVPPSPDAAEVLSAAITAGTPVLVTGDAAEPCPASTVMEDDETLCCDRYAGHVGSHHAPGPDEGSEVAWSDAHIGGGVETAWNEPVPAPELEAVTS